MKVEDLIVFGKNHCHSDHAKLLLADILNLNPLELLNYLNSEVSQEKAELYQREILALESGKPLQYVIGNVNFYGNKFIVNENVLIPRFETEELVENTILLVNKYFTNPVDIIDLGCGSGVIGLTLENKLSTNSVDLVDISPKALEITNINCGQMHSTKSRLIQSDMFSNIDKKYDIIISNPPYIKTTEEIEDIVRENEPHLALFAGETGLDCYEKILKDVSIHMKEKCIIAFEIGMTQAEEISALANKYLNNITIIVKKDMSEKDRMLFILKNCE